MCIRDRVVAAHIGSRLGNLGEDADDDEKVLSMFLSDKNDAASRQQLPDDIRCHRRTNLPGTTGDGLYVAMDSSSRQTPALALLANNLRTTDDGGKWQQYVASVSYTHLRAHETPEHLVCRLLLEKKKKMHGP
eukprot:TRINITY_DN21232_c0_g1_i2.p1 TRINITY_DN21232_c0_g1~~TRINITY_DN21232_c0_g1_i2.p1  ORF type:complete len:133 (+),score=42.01 TRINITY_DN21232_c0_g1_i2:128-526(+)